MKRLMLGVAALALLLVTTETASARPWYGVSAGYGWGGPYVGASYGTRVGNNGFLSVGYSTGFGGYGYGYPAYGYSYGYAAPAYYATPVYDTTYVAPTYYTTPSYYYSTPVYYSSPSIGFSYYSGGWGHRGWWR